MEVKPGDKQTEVGGIPEDWNVTTIGEQAQIFGRIGFRGYTVDDIVDEGHGAIAINPSNIQDGETVFEKCTYINWLKYEESPEIKIDEGDIILVKTGSTVGKTAMVKKLPEKATLNPQVVVFKKVKASPGFFGYTMGFRVVQKQLTETVVGGAVPTLSQKQVATFKFPLPPLPEQRAIATALSDVDGLLGGLDRLIAKKRDLKQAAMQQLLTGQTRLPGFKGEWVVKELGKLGKISGAGVDKKIHPGEPRVRLVNYMDVYRSSFIYSNELDHVVSAPADQAARCAVKKGDVFFTPSSEMPYDIAASAVAMEDITDACYSYHVVRLRLDEDWDMNFRAYAFKTQAFLDQAARTCEGSGVRYVITQGKFRQLTIRYPTDRAEQTAIADVLADMDADLAALEQRRAKTRALKQAMMQELLTGRIRLV